MREDGVTTVDREKQRQYNQAYYHAHRDRIKARVMEYYRANEAKKKAYGREYYLKNREVVVARYHQNPRISLAKSKAWKQRNKEKHSAHARKYYRLHLAQIKEYAKRYRKTHPGAHTAIIEKRRALQRAATINLTKITEWMQEVRRKPFAKCYYCGSKVSGRRLHFDHIVAIAKGGAHSVENLCVACADCNHSKHTKSVRAWVRVGQQMLEL